jgi:hypothetical protein
MGVWTSFFSATIEQLQRAAPGWVVPTYGAFRVHEKKNPFSGAIQTVKDFDLKIARRTR